MKIFNSNLIESPQFINSHNQWLLDRQGNRYFDTWLGAGTLIFGHAQELDKIGTDMLPEGIGLNEELTRLISKTVDFKIGGLGFQTSGSSAVARAVRLSRAITGRDKVAVIGNFWHGSDNEFLFKNDKQWLSLGVIENDSVEWFADIENFMIDAKINQYAALLIEPYQGSDPSRSLLDTIDAERRKEIKESGVLIIHDEVITGFRECFGSCYQSRRFKPDIVVFGKAIALGFPVGMVVVSEDILNGKNLEPFFWGGTFPCSPTQLRLIENALMKFEKIDYNIISENHWEIEKKIKSLLTENFKILSGCGFSRVLNNSSEKEARSFLVYNSEFDNLRRELLSNEIYLASNGLIFPSVFSIDKRG